MKKLFLLLSLLPLSCFAATPNATLAFQASGSGVQVNLTWTATGCASTITATSGTETAGPCFGSVYRATAASGNCPAFSATTYTVIASNLALTSTAAAFSDTTVPVGQVACYAVEDQFQAGGPASAPSNIFQILALIFGTPQAPSGLSGTTAP